MAENQLAHRHERKAQGSFRRCPGAGRRRTTTADQGQGPTTSAPRRGLAHRRTQDVGRQEILSRQPASEDWVCEQAHQQMKEELGLDHFEGQSWQGLHRHALMTMIAYAFLQHPRLATARREKRINGPPPQPTLPAVRHAASNSSLDYRLSDARIVENGFAASSGVSKSAKVVLRRVLIKSRLVTGT
jgi:hypothetical protein